MDIVGIRGSKGFDAVSGMLLENGRVAAVMEPSRVFGRSHIISAWEHARRSFDNGTNRSKSPMTEFLLYMAGERQISKALSIMRPSGNDIVIMFPDGCSSDLIHEFGGVRDDGLADADERKASVDGLKCSGMHISCEDLALEMVAMVDIMKG